MDKQAVLKQVDDSIKAQREVLENIDVKIEEVKHQAAVKESYLDGQRRAVKSSITALYELKAGLRAIE